MSSMKTRKGDALLQKPRSAFFNEYPRNATNFIALSGYLGLGPIRSIGELDLQSQIIFGMQKEANTPLLHSQLRALHNDNCRILYPEITCHSKCYLWLNGAVPIRGLIGSANFSSNGLLNPYREALFEVDRNQLFVLKGYIDIILNGAQNCSEVDINGARGRNYIEQNNLTCEMVLYDPRTGEVQPYSGLNWGFANANVRLNDALIAIRMDHIRAAPKLFPEIHRDPDDNSVLNQVVEFVWDDGFVMLGRLEGSQPRNVPVQFPKQIASYPNKDILGEYIRRRLNVATGQRVTMADLVRYGRNSITVSLIEEGVYSIDFSVR